MWYILSSLLFLIACGPLVYIEDRDPRAGHGVPPEVRPYLDSYEQAAGRQVYDIPVSFRPLASRDNPSRVGLCVTYGAGYAEIFLDPKYWEGARDSCREQLLFHELGHCDLLRGHTEDEQSIMYKNMMDCGEYAQGRNKILEELFRRTTKE